jgi:hypothetical protein
MGAPLTRRWSVKPSAQIVGLRMTEAVGSADSRTLSLPPLRNDLGFGPFWQMTTWLDDVAIIAAGHGVGSSSNAFVGAEEVLVDTSEAVKGVAEP